MALINLNLPIPASESAGDVVDTSGMDLNKTIQCLCGDQEIFDVEISNDDGTTWVPIFTFEGAVIAEVLVYAKLMRARVYNQDFTVSATATITANAISSTIVSGSIVVPNINPSGTIDTSGMSASKTVYCFGAEEEIIGVEISNDDGTTWTLVAELGAGEIADIHSFSSLMRGVPIQADYRMAAILAVAAIPLASGPEGTLSGGGGGSSVIYWNEQSWAAIRAQIPNIDSGLSIIIDLAGFPCSSYHIDSPCNFDNVQFTSSGTSNFQPSLIFDVGSAITGTGFRAKNITVFNEVPLFETPFFQLTLDGAGWVVDSVYPFGIITGAIVMVELTNGAWTIGGGALNPVFLMVNNSTISIDARGGGQAKSFTAATGDSSNIYRAVQVDTTSFIDDNAFGDPILFPSDNVDIYGDLKYGAINIYDNFAWPKTFRDNQDIQTNAKQMLNYLFTGIEDFNIRINRTDIFSPGVAGFFPENTRRYSANFNFSVVEPATISIYINYLNLRGEPDVLQITNAYYEHGEYSITQSFMANGDQLMAQLYGLDPGLSGSGVAIGDTLIVSSDDSSDAGVSRNGQYSITHILGDDTVVVSTDNLFPVFFQEKTNQVPNVGNCHIDIARSTNDVLGESLSSADVSLHTTSYPIYISFQQSTSSDGDANVFLSYSIKGV